MQELIGLWNKLYCKTYILDKFNVFGSNPVPKELEPLQFVRFAMQHAVHLEKVEANE